MKTFNKGETFTIGSTTYTVVREKEGYNGEAVVVATYIDSQGYEDFYTFNKKDIV